MKSFQNPLFERTPAEVAEMKRRLGVIVTQIYDHGQQLVRIRAGRIRLVKEKSRLEIEIGEQALGQKSDAAKANPGGV